MVCSRRSRGALHAVITASWPKDMLEAMQPICWQFHMQRRELKHIKALSQAVLQQRTDIELFLLSSLEMVR